MLVSKLNLLLLKQCHIYNSTRKHIYYPFSAIVFTVFVFTVYMLSALAFRLL